METVSRGWEYPTDVRINSWRAEYHYLLAPRRGRVGHGFVDLLWIDSNDRARDLIRAGYQPVPQEAARFLLDFSDWPVAPDWGSEGVFVVPQTVVAPTRSQVCRMSKFVQRF